MPFNVTSVNSYHSYVGLSKVIGQSRVTALGHLPAIGTPPADVWEGGGLFPLLAAASTLEVLSASANDTALGTGARTVLVSGLDLNYNTISETVTLNGVTPVPTVNQYLRVNVFTVVTSGSGGVNAGDITLRVVSAGSTQSIARAGYGFGRSAIYTVPNGFTLFIVSLVFSVLNAPGASIPGVVFGIAQRSSSGNLRIPLEFQVTANTPYRHDTLLGVVLTQKTDFMIRVTAVTNSASTCAAAMEGILFDNTKS